jgi:multiple sugar transport system substrate-binding protein
MTTEVAYVQYPAGPVRRAAVFGGSNVHIFKNTSDENVNAALEYIKVRLDPEWSNRLAWFSNPGNLDGFKDPYFELRKSQVKFLEVGTSMLEFGVPFPVIPEAAEIMNLVVPTMIHNALTKTMSIDDSVVDAEKKIKEIIARRA